MCVCVLLYFSCINIYLNPSYLFNIFYNIKVDICCKYESILRNMNIDTKRVFLSHFLFSLYRCTVKIVSYFVCFVPLYDKNPSFEVTAVWNANKQIFITR